MEYIESMVNITTERFDVLYSGIRGAHLLDWPDHENVGDSAIVLGALEYFRKAGISIKSAHSIGTLDRGVLKNGTPIILHGGGNFGGLYPFVEENRYAAVQGIPDHTVIIQAPQSVVFTNTSNRQRFIGALASRNQFRMGVRDSESLRRIEDAGGEAMLCPDAVHMLGRIHSPESTEELVILARTDGESSTGTPSAGTVDWTKDSPLARLSSAVRWRYRFLGPATKMLNPSLPRWERIAQERLDRGVRVLAPGQTIVTDRLHAMLIGLQMGRRVVAVDNNNGKLSSYAKTWLQSPSVRLDFAADIQSAVRLARKLI